MDYFRFSFDTAKYTIVCKHICVKCDFRPFPFLYNLLCYNIIPTIPNYSWVFSSFRRCCSTTHPLLESYLFGKVSNFHVKGKRQAQLWKCFRLYYTYTCVFLYRLSIFPKILKFCRGRVADLINKNYTLRGRTYTQS